MVKPFNRYFVLILGWVILVGCSDEIVQSPAAEAELFLSGAKISGVNGIHFGPDGYLYATSVIGLDISVVDTAA